MKNPITKFFIILLFVTCTISCKKQIPTKPEDVSYTYNIPPETGDGWEVSSLTDVGMRQSDLVDMMTFIDSTTDHRIHSILIIKNGKLIFEEYFKGYLFDTNEIESEGQFIKFGRDTLHFMASVTKSVTSVLFGIAMEQGLLQDVETKVLNYYPEYATILTEKKADIKIKHLLTMTAGLAWDEDTYPYSDSRNDVTGLFIHSDPIRFILEKPLESSPGLRFHYNSGYANILADIIRQSLDINIKTLAERQLFDQLNIKKYRWEMIHGDYVFASGGLYLKPRDLAKIGQLYLNGGTWKEQRIVSKEWIDTSIANYINPGFTNFSNGYGYQWWLHTFQFGEKSTDCFMAIGWGDQFMYCFPDEKMVVVMNGGYFFISAIVSSHSIVQNYILKSLL